MEEQYLKSKYSDFVDREHPLPEYPRPQLKRNDWCNLNGEYEYCILGKDEAYPTSFCGKIVVPFCVESMLSSVNGVLLPDEKIWYKRTFLIPEVKEDEKIILHFGAVDYKAEIYVNHEKTFTHFGGYLPFSIDITDFVNQGQNELIIGVWDPTDTECQERGKQVLSPQGIWYTATSGIWQTVWFEIVNEVSLLDLKIIPDFDNDTIRIKPIISDTLDLKLELKIFALESLVVETTIQENFWNDICIPDCIAWTPDSPFLYSFTIDVFKNSIKTDSISSYFGIRKFDIQSDDFGRLRTCLNNKPIFQTGVLDQGYYPESLLTPPTDQAMIDDIQTMKNLGFNMIRKHIKIEPARWYYHCDRLGMLVWQDMPSGGIGNPGNFLAVVLPYLNIHIKDNHYKWFGRENETCRIEFESNLEHMVQYLGFFTSIYCWVPFNEGWGQFDSFRIGKRIKELDPSRTVDHASGWHDQLCGDYISVHRYIMKIKKPKNNHRSFVLSEFGGYSLVEPDHTWNEEKSFGYKMYKSSNSLTKAFRSLYEKQIMPLISKGLNATIYTQLSDVELEVNGILTYDRSIVKIDENTIKSINKKLKEMLDVIYRTNKSDNPKMI